MEAKELSNKIDSIRPADSARILIALGSVQLELGEIEKAEHLVKKGLDELLDNVPPEHWLNSEAKGELGIYYLSINENNKAKKLLTESFYKLKKVRGKDSTITKRVYNNLCKLL